MRTLLALLLLSGTAFAQTPGVPSETHAYVAPSDGPAGPNGETPPHNSVPTTVVSPPPSTSAPVSNGQ